MKLHDRKYQAATKVKVLSPEMSNFVVVDSFHLLEDNNIHFNKVRNVYHFRGLSPWHGIESNLQELGRSKRFFVNEISSDNLKRRERGNGRLEVGLSHIRGVVGVMPYERNKTHSKGIALVCRDKETHGPYKERD